MKESLKHIIGTWLLLVFFVAGQVVLYSHHHGEYPAAAKAQHQISNKTSTEKCGICDALHFNSMDISHAVCFKPALSNKFLFIVHTNFFSGVAPFPSAGRSPPLS